MFVSTSCRGSLPALALVAGLAACSGQQTATGGLIPETASPIRQPLPEMQVKADNGSFKPDAGIRIFTANRGGEDVLGFSVNASGNVAPAVTIGGSKTTLADPVGLALDASGNIYTANDSG